MLTELRVARAEAAKLRKDRTVLAAKVDALRGELCKLYSKLEQTQSKLCTVLAEHECLLKETLAEPGVQRTRTMDSNSQQSVVDWARKELEETKSALDVARSQLGVAQLERDTLIEELPDLRAEVAALRAEIHDAESDLVTPVLKVQPPDGQHAETRQRSLVLVSATDVEALCSASATASTSLTDEKPMTRPTVSSCCATELRHVSELTQNLDDTMGRVRICRPDGKGRCLFALGSHKRNDVVFAEAPLFSTRTIEDPEVYQSLQCLNAEDNLGPSLEHCYAAIMSLRCSEVVDKMLELYLPPRGKEAHLYKMSRNSAKRMSEIHPMTRDQQQQLENLIMAWRFNGFDEENDAGRAGLSVFETISLCAHSCRPSCIIDVENDVSVVRAKTDLMAGDEITLSYLPACTLRKGKAARQLAVDQGWGFKCKCSRCGA